MLCVSAAITLCLSSHLNSALDLYIHNCKYTLYIGQPTSPLDSPISFGARHYVVFWLFDCAKISAVSSINFLSCFLFLLWYIRRKQARIMRVTKICMFPARQKWRGLCSRLNCAALVLSCVTKMSINIACTFFFFIVAHCNEELPDSMRILVDDKAQKIYFRQQATSTTIGQIATVAL